MTNVVYNVIKFGLLVSELFVYTQPEQENPLGRRLTSRVRSDDRRGPSRLSVVVVGLDPHSGKSSRSRLTSVYLIRFS